MMKKVVALLLALISLMTFITGCGQNGRKPYDVGERAAAVLDGKKILIVGCSYNFYGKIVNNVSNKVTDQESRTNDTGYFYELCKQNGANVSVTNWCFGGHDLSDLLGTSCAADRECGNGHNHLADLVDRDFDYISLMDIERPNTLTDAYVDEIKSYMKIFTDVNPDCKFIISIPCGAYWNVHKARDPLYQYMEYIDEIARLDNVIIVDWGKLIYDLIDWRVKIEGSDFLYTENTFIVSDGYHPNPLSGYINTVMTYCAITGETAVGQPTNLYNGSEIGAAVKFSKENFEKSFYKGSTNFAQILDSELDMKGLQSFIDKYLAKDEAYFN